MLRKTKGLLLAGLMVAVVCIMISVNIDATPDKNDGDRAVSGCDTEACHGMSPRGHTYQENTNKQPPVTNLYLEEYEAEGTFGWNIIFYNNNSADREKLSHENSSGPWKEIKVAAELADEKKDGPVYYNITGNGPHLIVYAPDEGDYIVRAGYWNESQDELFYTEFSVTVTYRNQQPTANASWGGFEDFEVISGGTGDEDTVVRFPEEGKGTIYFEAEGSDDPNPDDKTNLSYYWDINDKDGSTNNNDTGSEGKTDCFYTFDVNDIEPGVRYQMTLSVTDNHVYKAWDHDIINITFLEPLRYPDLNVTYAKMDPSETQIGEQMTINMNIKNIGDNDITTDDSFTIKVLNRDKIPIIPDQTLNVEIAELEVYSYQFIWGDTSKFADGSDVLQDIWYDMEIEIDINNDIMEVQRDENTNSIPDGEENNEYTIRNAFRFVESIVKPVELEIAKFTWESPNATDGKIEEDELIYVNVSVKNIGEGDAMLISVRLWDNTAIEEDPEPKSFRSPDGQIYLTGEYYNVTFKIRPERKNDQNTEDHTLELVVKYQDQEYNDTENLVVTKVGFVPNIIFSLSLDYKQYLVEGPVGEELKTAFKDKGSTLSNKAKIEIISDTKWEIEDSTNLFLYTIEDNGQELEVYRDIINKPITEDETFDPKIIIIGAVIAIVVAVVVVLAVRKK